MRLVPIGLTGREGAAPAPRAQQELQPGQGVAQEGDEGTRGALGWLTVDVATGWFCWLFFFFFFKLYFHL